MSVHSPKILYIEYSIPLHTTDVFHIQQLFYEEFFVVLAGWLLKYLAAKDVKHKHHILELNIPTVPRISISNLSSQSYTCLRKVGPFSKIFENYIHIITHYNYCITYTTLADNTHHGALSNRGHRAREE